MVGRAKEKICRAIWPGYAPIYRRRLTPGIGHLAHVGLSLPVFSAASGKQGVSVCLSWVFYYPRRTHMPIIAWLLGVPISVIILLMLFGVF